MKFFWLAFVYALIFNACADSEISFRNGSIEAIFEEAKRERKKVFVLVVDRGCGSCDAFLESLKRSPGTVEALNRDYLSYIADVQDMDELPIAQIVKCPSFPFPYFFDSTGDLLAFGFPNSKQFDISDLNAIGIEDLRFKELFRLPVSISDYKRLVTHSLKGYLAMKDLNSNSSGLRTSLRHALISDSISSYPFSRFLIAEVNSRLNTDSPNYIRRISSSELTSGDRLIYRNIIHKYPELFKSDTVLDQSQPNDSSKLLLSTRRIDIGKVKKNEHRSFSLTLSNTGSVPIFIQKIHHPCSCVEIEKYRDTIPINGVVTVKGIYHSNEVGGFQKEIYIHITSSASFMQIVTLEGVIVD